MSGWKEGGSEIAPFEKYKGDKAKACWFPDAKTAYAWQAFVTFKPQLKLKNPPGLGDGQPFILHKVGEAIEVQVAGKPKTKGAIEVWTAPLHCPDFFSGMVEEGVVWTVNRGAAVCFPSNLGRACSRPGGVSIFKTDHNEDIHTCSLSLDDIPAGLGGPGCGHRVH